MVAIQFDDLVYSLQSFGGASVYWKEVTSRVEQDGRFHSLRNQPPRCYRGLPTRSCADIFHSSHFRMSVFGKAKNVSTVHDLNYELGYVKRGFKPVLNILERRASYFTADALICISHSTRKELLDVYPQLIDRCPIHVVHHGFTDFKHEALTGDPIPQFGPYVLYVGARRGYKRFVDVLSGFHSSEVWRDGVKLVCTGNEFDSEESAEIARFGLRGFVASAGKVNTASLATLYQQAHCLVYSSVHEGFGLPLLEAMNKDCPVVACNISCIPEIVDDAAILVRPNSAEDISRAILALQDVNLRALVISKGRKRVKEFSWDKSAQAHMDIYLHAANK